MDKNTTNIKNELDQTTKRINELREMRLQINGNLQTLQQGFIDGKTSLDALQNEQNRLTTIDSSTKALEAKQSQIQADLDEAERQEKRQILLGKAKTIAVESETAFDEYLEIRKEFDSTIGTYAEKMFDTVVLFRSKQQEFARTLKQIDPETIVSPQFIPSENRDSYNQINKELEQIGLNSETRNLASSYYLNLPATEFNQSIIIAETLLGQKKEREKKGE